jgi:hypothetical protein
MTQIPPAIAGDVLVRAQECPKCGARPFEPCKRSDHNAGQPHRARERAAADLVGSVSKR